MEQAINTLP